MEVTPKYKIDMARDLRQRQTPSEAVLWKALRGHRLDGLGFRRQHPIGRFVADFCCEKARLVVEVDGGYHETPEQPELDAERAAHFTGRGYIVLRITNDEVMMDLKKVLNKIRTTVHVSEAELPSPAAGEGQGVGA